MKTCIYKNRGFFLSNPWCLKDQVTLMPLQMEYLMLYHGNGSQLHQVQHHHMKVVVCQIAERNDGQQQRTQQRGLHDQKVEPVSTPVSIEVCSDCCCKLQL